MSVYVLIRLLGAYFRHFVWAGVFQVYRERLTCILLARAKLRCHWREVSVTAGGSLRS